MIQSLYLSALFRKFLLEENIHDLTAPPYFNEDFFKTIKAAKTEGYDITTMKIRNWFAYLIENDPILSLQPKIILNNPNINWPMVWTAVQLPCLTSEEKSFAYKMVHRLLPIEDRVSKILPHSSPLCKFKCKDESGATLVADQHHIFFWCKAARNVGVWLLELVRTSMPSITAADILSLSLGDAEEITWHVIHTLSHIWSKRKEMKEVNLGDLLGQLDDSANMMLDTRFDNIVTPIKIA